MAGQENLADVNPSCKEGPVLVMINKRLRALKKKYNRVLQIEESKSQGKQINKEQEEVLKSKLSVEVLIDEYEKLRSPLMVAVREEVQKELIEFKENLERQSTGKEDEHADEDTQEKELTEIEHERADDEEQADVPGTISGDSLCDESAHSKSPDNVVADDQHMDSPEHHTPILEHEIVDLLHLLYFSQLFDVPQATALPSVIWTKTHERSSCVSYDCVTDEDSSSSPLKESDLSDITTLGSLIISRPPNMTLSHQDALQECARHALLWLRNSDVPIGQGLNITYSHLRERLSRILSSKYYTVELQTTDPTLSGQYIAQLLGSGGSSLMESQPPLFYVANQGGAPDVHLQGLEHYRASVPTSNVPPRTHDALIISESAVTYAPERDPSHEVEQGNSVSGSNGDEEQQHTHFSTPLEHLESRGPLEGEEQQHDVITSGVDVRGYQEPSGSSASSSNHAKGGRVRGYPNGRGTYGIARGGHGNAQLHDHKGYYSRNQYVRGNGRGGRGGSAMFGAYASGQANSRATIGGGPPPA